MASRLGIIGIVAMQLIAGLQLTAQSVDYSVVNVNEESGMDLVQITKASDYVAMPVVTRSAHGISWFTNRILDVAPDGNSIAFISVRNNLSNIFLKDLTRQGGATQRTQRSSVIDFSFAPDGKTIAFTEKRGKANQLFTTSATSGYVCRQITAGESDYSPVYSRDMKRILFCRLEQRGSTIWGHDIANNFLSSYYQGMNPSPLDDNWLIVARNGTDRRSEIWRVNYDTGVEECIVSDPQRSFTSPSISPDGQWILMVGDSMIDRPKSSPYRNTDIFVVRVDGSEFTQLTYHAADDISPAWGPDGKSIYFISQRGSADATPNVWRMTFNR